MLAKPSWRAWLIWALAASFFLSEYFSRVAPSVMVPLLMRDFNVHALGLGALSAYFYYAYICMQIPVGTLMDRFGAHRLLTVTAAICGAGCFLFASTHHLPVAEFGRLLMGFGAAFAFVGALKLASVWFPASRFGFLAGSTQALGMLGAMIGEGPVSVLVSHVGWRNTMFAIGGLLLLIALLIGIVVRDHPEYHPKSQEVIRSLPEYTLLGSLWRVLQNPQTWLNAAFVGFLYAPTAAFGELWGASYLHRVYNLSPDVAASAVSMIFLGWAVGSPIGGWISDRIQARKPVMLVSTIASFIFICLALYLPVASTLLLFICLFLYGMSNVGVATCYAVAREINPPAVAGTSMSFANMASIILGALFQPVIGALLDLRWHHLYKNGIPYYGPTDYHFAMLILPVCFLVCIVLIGFMHESYKAE